MARQEDGWLGRNKGGEAGIWVARQEDGWLGKKMGG